MQVRRAGFVYGLYKENLRNLWILAGLLLLVFCSMLYKSHNYLANYLLYRREPDPAALTAAAFPPARLGLGIGFGIKIGFGFWFRFRLRLRYWYWYWYWHFEHAHAYTRMLGASGGTRRPAGRLVLCTYANYKNYLQYILDNPRNVNYNVHRQEGVPMRNLNMKFRRIELGMSQTELARRAGVTRQTIGLIEAGEFNPSIKLCLAICRALGVTLNDLFWEDESNEEAEE